MGFGILAIGYLFLFRIAPMSNGIDLLPDFIGYLILFAGLRRLGIYGKYFKIASKLAIPLMILSVPVFSSEILPLFGFALPETFATVLFAIRVALRILQFAFHVSLLFGIRDIARETDLPKVASRAVRNLFITSFFYLLLLASVLLPMVPLLPQIAQVFEYLWLLINFILIFSCYMWICLEGDENMPTKPSRFAFINRMNDRIDAALDKTERAGREAAAAKQKKKKSKKKK